MSNTLDAAAQNQNESKSNQPASTTTDEVAIDLGDSQIAGSSAGTQNEDKPNPKKDAKVKLPLSPLQMERSLSAAAVASVKTPTAMLHALSKSPLSAKAVQKVSENKVTASILILIYFLGMSVACFYIASGHDDDESACNSDDDYIMDLNVGWFLYAAGTTSFFQLALTSYAWYNGCVPEEEESQFDFGDGSPGQNCCDHIIHFLCCIGFWNIVWSILGFIIWGDQMNEECQMEDAPMMILVWSSIQVE